MEPGTEGEMGGSMGLDSTWDRIGQNLTTLTRDPRFALERGRTRPNQRFRNREFDIG